MASHINWKESGNALTINWIKSISLLCKRHTGVCSLEKKETTTEQLLIRHFPSRQRDDATVSELWTLEKNAGVIVCMSCGLRWWLAVGPRFKDVLARNTQRHTSRRSIITHSGGGDFTTIGSLKLIDENRSHYQSLYPHPPESQRDAFQCAAPDVWPLLQMLVFAVFIYLPDPLRGEPWVELWG